MALNVEWDNVIERFHNLRRFRRLRPIVNAMLRLIAILREDSRFESVIPDVSLASLNLRLSYSKRYVVVVWSEKEPQGFEISFVDPPLEFSEITKVCEAKAVTTIIEYLDRLKGE